MDRSAELTRQQQNLNNLGTVIDVNETDGLCRVEIGGNQTDWIPFACARSGDTQVWMPPSIGEQVELISQSGELSTAIVGQSVCSDANPPPQNPSHPQIRFKDGAEFRYDPDAHVLFVNLPSGTAKLQCDVEIDGSLEVNGTATANDFVTKTQTSLNNHVHRDVRPGIGISGLPITGGSTGGSGGSGSDATADIGDDEMISDPVAYYILARG